jgi:hypothetical protein
MKRVVFAIAVAATLCPSHAANARQWWMILASEDRCLTPQELQARFGIQVTPDLWDQAMRKKGIVLKTNVFKDPNGNVTTVMLGEKDTFVVFATSAHNCQIALNTLQKSGVIPNRNDLR